MSLETSAQKRLSIDATGAALKEFTAEAARFVHDARQRFNCDTGLMTALVPHTSCSLLIQENPDPDPGPDVRSDLAEFFRRLAPDGDAPAMSWLRHTTEGPDDMPAHIKAALTNVSLSVPVTDGRLALGAWQGLFLFEHRRAPQRRTIILHLSACAV